MQPYTTFCLALLCLFASVTFGMLLVQLSFMYKSCKFYHCKTNFLATFVQCSMIFALCVGAMDWYQIYYCYTSFINDNKYAIYDHSLALIVSLKDIFYFLSMLCIYIVLILRVQRSFAHTVYHLTRCEKIVLTILLSFALISMSTYCIGIFFVFEQSSIVLTRNFIISTLFAVMINDLLVNITLLKIFLSKLNKMVCSLDDRPSLDNLLRRSIILMNSTYQNPFANNQNTDNFNNNNNNNNNNEWILDQTLDDGLITDSEPLELSQMTPLPLKLNKNSDTFEFSSYNYKYKNSRELSERQVELVYLMSKMSVLTLFASVLVPGFNILIIIGNMLHYNYSNNGYFSDESVTYVVLIGFIFQLIQCFGNHIILYLMFSFNTKEYKFFCYTCHTRLEKICVDKVGRKISKKRTDIIEESRTATMREVLLTMSNDQLP